MSMNLTVCAINGVIGGDYPLWQVGTADTQAILEAADPLAAYFDYVRDVNPEFAEFHIDDMSLWVEDVRAGGSELTWGST